MMLRKLYLLTVVMAVTGCHQASTLSPATPSPTPRLYALPTATEVFNLRSKCAELGDKILDNNLIGKALTQDVLSHYNPATNRCYVRLDVRDMNDINEYWGRYLYDGQTKDLLMFAKIEKGKKTGSDFLNDNVMLGYDGAAQKIEEFMADDHK